MTDTVEFTTAAARQVKKLPRAERGKVVDAIAQLEEDPRPHGARKLVGEKTAWRIRVGDYRVIYDVFDQDSWSLWREPHIAVKCMSAEPHSRVSRTQSWACTPATSKIRSPMIVKPRRS